MLERHRQVDPMIQLGLRHVALGRLDLGRVRVDAWRQGVDAARLAHICAHDERGALRELSEVRALIATVARDDGEDDSEKNRNKNLGREAHESLLETKVS